MSICVGLHGVLVLHLALAALQWPYPIPCRIQDGNNPDLFIMTLGQVQTGLAQGTFYPSEDKVILNDGQVIEHYYRDRLGIRFYQPIDKRRFPLPPSGWCTWYYYYSRITAEEVKRNARWIAENLKDYGARIVQIDDGWQVPPRDWTDFNKERFPQGIAEVAQYIRSLGLIPGIWLAPHGQSNETFVMANKEVFLLRPDGTTASQTWEGRFLVDPTTSEAHAYLRGLFERLCQFGFDYFKIDGQPIVVNEYRTKTQFMKGPSGPGEELYRKTITTIRQAIGPDRYLLGCWGIPLEGIGLMDGSRTGGDIVLGWGGFKVALRAIMEYSYLHNVVWYCDPDVMVLRSPLTLEQARVWATVQGLTGQALMASDRLMDLGPERVELMRRVYPAVDIRPLDLFPNNREKRIWDLKVSHLGRKYDVVGLFNFDQSRSEQILLRWADLGLPSDVPIHVFDFWNAEYLGAWEAGIAVDVAPTSCRVLTLLVPDGKVQLISTSRHITQGWVDLKRIDYNDTTSTFTGTSSLIEGDPYQLRFVFPRGRNMAVRSVTAAGLPTRWENHQGWAAVVITSDKTADIDWKVEFMPSELYHYPPEAPSGLNVRPVGLDGVEVSWSEQYWLNAGYRVYLDDKPLVYAPRASLTIGQLDPNTTYNLSVETVSEDGSASGQRTRTTFRIASMISSRIRLSQLEGQRTGRPTRRVRTDMPLTIGQEVYTDALVIAPGSAMTYRLKGLFDRFVAKVAVAQGQDELATVQFRLLGDGRQIWQSEPIGPKDGIRQVEVGIKGIDQLTLEVAGSSGAGRAGRVTAAWLDAELLR